jgi:hypothetical protein
LRRELAKINVSVPEPDPWDKLRDPRVRAVYIMLTLPVPLLEAEVVVDVDPRLDEIEAAAAARYPAIAATMRELVAAMGAAERGDPLVLPTPSPQASAEAKNVLSGPHLRVDYRYGRMNKRWLPPEDGGITWSTETFDGCVEVVIDTWATRTWLLERSVNQLWGNRDADAGIAWYLRRRGDGDTEAAP